MEEPAFDPAKVPLADALGYVKVWEFGQIQVHSEDTHVQTSLEVIQNARSAAGKGATGSVVVERFIPMRLNMTREFLSPVRIEACLGYALRTRKEFRKLWEQERLEYVLQSPSQAKTALPDQRLQHVSQWARAAGLPSLLEGTKGKDHARDAIRHKWSWLLTRRSGKGKK